MQVSADMWASMLTEPEVREAFAASMQARRVRLRSWIEDAVASGELVDIPANAFASILLALSDDFVFTTLTGMPLDGRNVTRDFQLLLRRAGLPRIRFHDLRHSAATLLLAEGVSARVVMDVLGHSQISVTLNTYGHVIPPLMKDAAMAMDRVFSQRDRQGTDRTNER